MHFYERIAQLENEHASFAIATVVARKSPVSSHLGDRALVFADGHMEGFVGGSCSRDIVRRQALAAIRQRRPHLLQIRPETNSDERLPADAERVVIPMSCTSEGAVDVYIEPRIPLRRLVVVGFTPVADALARLAATLDYDIVRVVVEDELRDVPMLGGVRVIGLHELPDFFAAMSADALEALVAIVASQGHYDEAALEVLLAQKLAFVGLLASRRRAATVFGVLTQQGIGAERLANVRTPVGLDIGARSPGEVAVSVLAEIISLTPSQREALCDERAQGAGAMSGDATTGSVDAAEGVDPVCGMEVEVATASHRFTYEGRMFAFCCAGCRFKFAANPASFLPTPEHA
jgi:xanthine dehydrogenase accessory factor